jgi:pSer/pThr/pTyr-binding forkhead associated (FHA) protein
MEPASLVVVIDPNGHRTRVALDPLPFSIGRQPESNLIIRDSRVSRTHARIVVRTASTASKIAAVFTART